MSTPIPSTSVHGDETATLIDDFSERLSQAYEEINLLFRFSHFLNAVEDPPAVVALAIDQVAQVLAFGWIAAWFRSDGAVAPSLAGKVFRSATLPCSEAFLNKVALQFGERADADHWTHVLEPGQHELATLIGGEVIVEPIAHEGACVGMIFAGSKAGPDPEVSSGDIQFLDAVAAFLGVFHQNSLRVAEQQMQFLGTLRALSAAIDAKDPYTCGHSDRVALLAAQMARALDLPRAQVDQFRIAGQLHDVGKIGVPEAVLCKTTRLTDEEFGLIKKHPEIGSRILQAIPGIEPMLPGVLHHHERWDGGGYPHRLRGADIPLIGRCLALCDTFDAMSSTRAYRAAMPRKRVLAEIQRCAGAQFCPELARVFLRLDFSDFDDALQAAVRYTG